MIVSDDWGLLSSSLAQVFGLKAGKKAMIITDETVGNLYLNEVKNHLEANTPWHISTFAMPAGEKEKNIHNLQLILQAFHDEGLDRSSIIFALGGGVVSDIVGFAASIYMRGLCYVNLPTTLMAQVDAAIGGKTAIDFLGDKNLIGTFHQPSLIYANIGTLATLPQKEYISGLAEVIKYGIIKDKELLDFLREHKDGILKQEKPALLHIINASCNIKVDVVAKDEKDAGERQLLNFGHTFGHAIEALLGFSLPHGHCVALGMVCALEYSARHLGLSPVEHKQALSAIDAFDLPLKLPSQFSLTPQEVYDKMLRDKKVADGQMSIICTEKIGSAVILKNPNEEWVLKAIEAIL
ncbi:MAG: 3-dehydroquinate synthase [Defluviitaleaceae bacterium]|nr:3-dehydroquinate synthase [Defluviitaleaceae bacterium]